MVDYNYRENTNARSARRRVFRVVVISISTVILLIAGYIIYDALNTSTLVTNSPPATSTLGQQAEQSVFDEPTFRLVTDASWREAPPIDEETNSFRYQKVENELVRASLTIFVDDIPENLAVTHVLPVEADGINVVSHSVSPHCSELQPDEDNRRDIELAWFGVTFLCDPDLNAYIAGSSHPKGGYGIQLEGDEGGHRYFFLFRDSRAVGQLDDFPRVLTGFEVK